MKPRQLAPAAALLLGLSCAAERPGNPASPEARAVTFLAREVRAWPVKNKCFSCHNNGDAARALYAAGRASLQVDPASIDPTTRWLSRPDEWTYNGPKGEFSDKRLAALQFAFALSAAAETGRPEAQAALPRAGDILLGYQDPEGCWTVDAGGLPGSPVTYGRILATVAGRKVLAQADPARFSEAIRRADAWLLRQRPAGVLDAAALLLGLSSLQAPEAEPLRREMFEILRKGQARDGGWGPYVTSPPEVFDTAIALLGLATVPDREADEMIRRGREFLLQSQLDDGGWPETTRPPGVESYAQRISTTGWATLALLRSRP